MRDQKKYTETAAFGWGETSRKHKDVYGRAAQHLRKKVDGKELSKEEQPVLTRSDKRKASLTAESNKKVQTRGDTRDELVGWRD